MNIVEQVGAVVREVRSTERDGKPARIVVATRLYEAQAEEVWDAVTNPERIPRWFLPISGELRVFGRYQLKGNAGGTITSCDPPRSFALTWEFGGQTTWLAVTLSSEAKRTRLVLEHTVPVDAHFTKYGPGAVGVGWDLTLRGLGLHLPTNAKVDPGAFMAWTGSDEGKAFIRATAADWCRAWIADGEDPAHARMVSDTTAAFYTGEAPPAGT